MIPYKNWIVRLYGMPGNYGRCVLMMGTLDMVREKAHRLFGYYPDIYELLPIELAYLNEHNKTMPEEEYERIKVARTKEPVKQWRNAWEEMTVAEE
jgi:hypothetical protein